MEVSEYIILLILKSQKKFMTFPEIVTKLPAEHQSILHKGGNRILNQMVRKKWLLSRERIPRYYEYYPSRIGFDEMVILSQLISPYLLSYYKVAFP
jgi:hypothetical protein